MSFYIYFSLLSAVWADSWLIRLCLLVPGGVFGSVVRQGWLKRIVFIISPAPLMEFFYIFFPSRRIGKKLQR